MEFRLLGPVAMWHHNRRADIGHAKQRSVLAVLLYEAGRPVPVPVLIDRVWGHEPPDSALNVLYAYVARLRAALRPVGVALTKQSAGYHLDVPRLCVDLHRFQALLAAAETSTEPARASAAFDAAVALWHGTPLADVTAPWAAGVRRSLRDRYLSALIARNETWLAAGRHRQLAAQLPGQVAAHPLDQRLVGQLMLALYRCGRPNDALGEYRRARDRVAARLGTEPGPLLRDLQRRMLRGDPELLGGRNRSAVPVLR